MKNLRNEMWTILGEALERYNPETRDIFLSSLESLFKSTIKEVIPKEKKYIGFRNKDASSANLKNFGEDCLSKGFNQCIKQFNDNLEKL